eukprot:SAG11_NODE_13998_length_629_cov_1.156604_1_plen_154_part_10
MLKSVVTTACIATSCIRISHAVPAVSAPDYLQMEPPSEPSTYEIKLHAEAGKCDVAKAGWGQIHRLATKQVYTTSVPTFMSEGGDGEDSKDDYVQIYAPTALSAWGKAAEMCNRGLSNATLNEEHARLEAKREVIEIRPIRETGPSSNRIDVVF